MPLKEEIGEHGVQGLEKTKIYIFFTDIVFLHTEIIESIS